jgi:hypothetical protein
MRRDVRSGETGETKRSIGHGEMQQAAGRRQRAANRLEVRGAALRQAQALRLEAKIRGQMVKLRIANFEILRYLTSDL